MRFVTLGKTGLKVSAVGFGGIPIQRVTPDEATKAIHKALDLGVNFIDTAMAYTDSQEKIGAALKGRRDGLVIATKGHQRTGEAILAEVDKARDALGIDRIDLMQMHGVSKPDALEAIQAPGGAIEGLLVAKAQGKIAHIGASSHSLDMALKLVEIPEIETIQFPFNLVTSEPADELIPKARAAGVGFIVMKPLCGGQYDNARLAFKYLNGFPDIVPIPGIETPAEIEEIVEIVESGEVLAGVEKAEANEIVARLGKVFCRRCLYCQPCPQGVKTTQAMIFSGIIRRMSAERAKKAAASVIESVSRCVECGQCETKCPYDLKIIQTIGESAALARTLV